MHLLYLPHFTAYYGTRVLLRTMRGTDNYYMYFDASNIDSANYRFLSTLKQWSLTKYLGNIALWDVNVIKSIKLK